jgi:hypothetical protein
VTALITALVVGGAATAFYFMVLNRAPTLDKAAVEKRVEEILRNDFGISVDSGSVLCPHRMSAEAGAKYVCDYATTAGQSADAQITVVNEGQYLVGAVGEGEQGALVDPLAEGSTGEAETFWQDLGGLTDQ